ncbi:unnamed protein product, partial [Ascophyllum nodosum]
CDVFLFNYRGYGRSGGKASPSGITKDVREVSTPGTNPFRSSPRVEAMHGVIRSL